MAVEQHQKNNGKSKFQVYGNKKSTTNLELQALTSDIEKLIHKRGNKTNSY